MSELATALSRIPFDTVKRKRDSVCAGPDCIIRERERSWSRTDSGRAYVCTDIFLMHLPDTDRDRNAGGIEEERDGGG